MHIEPDALKLSTESDVEQKLLMPLLIGSQYLNIPQDCIYTKDYIAPTQLDKAAGRTTGYFPDYSIWISGFPILIVEAKSPEVDAAVGYREASLYARHLNQQYPTDLNPARFILASNGLVVLFGYWDSQPTLEIPIKNLMQGQASLERLRTLCNFETLDQHAQETLRAIRVKRSVRPFNIAGDQALLASKEPLNTFAAELSPILRRYFSSSSQDDNKEIAERG